MTKAEWISVIQNTLMKIDETGIYRAPLIERHIQSVYEQMYNELYRQDKRSISQYTSLITQALPSTLDMAAGVTMSTLPINLPRTGGGLFGVSLSPNYSDLGFIITSYDGCENTKNSRFDTSGFMGKYVASVLNDILYFNYEYVVQAGWHLPSKNELLAMCSNLLDYGVGNFVRDNDIYWSSSQSAADEAWGVQIFHPEDAVDLGKNYGEISHYKFFTNPSRPCRTFTAAEGAYSLRDVGPAGGLIFYIDGTTYYEAAPADIADMVWSNVDDVSLTGTSIEIGDGLSNTLAIIAQSDHATSAASVAYAVELSLSLVLRMIPKFTSLASTDEVMIPGGAEDHFIDRVIDTVRHMQPTDLINDNAIQ